jgi:hypothetical protein
MRAPTGKNRIDHLSVSQPISTSCSAALFHSCGSVSKDTTTLPVVVPENGSIMRYAFRTSTKGIETPVVYRLRESDGLSMLCPVFQQGTFEDSFQGVASICGHTSRCVLTRCSRPCPRVVYLRVVSTKESLTQPLAHRRASPHGLRNLFGSPTKTPFFVGNSIATLVLEPS